MDTSIPADVFADAFAAQVRATPDRPAVSAAGAAPTRLTFRELDERANRLANRLLELGAGPDRPVAVLMERSADLVTALLAVVKTGGFYLPLHTDHPLERMQWILDHADRPPLLTDTARQRAGLPESGPVVVVDGEDPWRQCSADAPRTAATADDLLYLIYTSGTTGEPKGVAITRREALALVRDSCWDGGRQERVLMNAPYAFNVSTYECWVPLLHGGCVCVAPPGPFDLATLRKLVADERITAIHLTAGLFRVVAEQDPGCLAPVREVLTGGDVISPTAVNRVLEACPDTLVRTMYGMTEMTVFSVQGTITEPIPPGGRLALGRPMDGVRLHVLDDGLAPVAPGAPGELYLAGRGLARGYFRRPDLTAERFVANPFDGPDGRMYRTGDIVRINAEGALEFVGRATNQVKIMGFRVEPGEAEAVLGRFPGVGQVSVVTRPNPSGESALVAYVTAGPDGLDVDALRAHAARLLPPYMAIAAFVTLEALPLTPNGKIDRDALPEPVFASGGYRAPRTEREKLLCREFAESLGVPRVGLDDGFFQLGGQSLGAMRLIGRLHARLGVALSITDFFAAPTVAGVEDLLAHAEEDK